MTLGQGRKSKGFGAIIARQDDAGIQPFRAGKHLSL
jgi:hypothetical protein